MKKICSICSTLSGNNLKNRGGLGRLRQPFRFTWGGSPPCESQTMSRGRGVFPDEGGRRVAARRRCFHADNGVSFDYRGILAVFSGFFRCLADRSRYWAAVASLGQYWAKIRPDSNDQNGVFVGFRTRNFTGFRRISFLVKAA